MKIQGLQTDKLTPVHLPEICAPRQALLKTFDRAAEKRCVYVAAPAGCGKTLSALLWTQSAGRTPIWIGLDEYDNTLPAFYRLFLYRAFFFHLAGWQA